MTATSHDTLAARLRRGAGQDGIEDAPDVLANGETGNGDSGNGDSAEKSLHWIVPREIKDMLQDLASNCVNVTSGKQLFVQLVTELHFDFEANGRARFTTRQCRLVPAPPPATVANCKPMMPENGRAAEGLS